jgi:spore maturation protein CgeB
VKAIGGILNQSLADFAPHNSVAIVKQCFNLRDFKASMVGAMYLTDFCVEISEFFESDREVLIYRDEPELLNKIRYYQCNPEEMEKIRQAGYTRVLQCHTYQQRFHSVFKQMGFCG